MKTLVATALFFTLCFVSCEKQSVSYTISLSDSSPAHSELWQNGTKESYYTGLYVTANYYAFSEYENDSALKIFGKKDPDNCLAFYKKPGEEPFYTIDFLKSNTRYAGEEDDIWFVENKNRLKQFRIQSDSLITQKNQSLHYATLQSSSYNFTKEEMYAVPASGNSSRVYYFFQPDSGHYWVEMGGTRDKPIDKIYSKNPYAFLANLCVNEKHQSVVSAFLFFNQIQFFDLQGNYLRSVTIGEDEILPLNNHKGSLDYEGSRKCFIDICGTERYVYCLYDGSENMEHPSFVFVFKWDGSHVATYQTDRTLKKIAVDEKEGLLVALASNNEGGRDVVRINIKEI